MNVPSQDKSTETQQEQTQIQPKYQENQLTGRLDDNVTTDTNSHGDVDEY